MCFGKKQPRDRWQKWFVGWEGPVGLVDVGLHPLVDELGGDAAGGRGSVKEKAREHAVAVEPVVGRMRFVGGQKGVRPVANILATEEFVRDRAGVETGGEWVLDRDWALCE